MGFLSVRMLTRAVTGVLPAKLQPLRFLYYNFIYSVRGVGPILSSHLDHMLLAVSLRYDVLRLGVLAGVNPPDPLAAGRS